jgi:hypothetical protein
MSKEIPMYTTFQRLGLVAIVLALFAPVGRAATIGYWEFDDQAPGNTAGTLATQVNSPDLDGTAVANGGGAAVKPDHHADRPGAVITDGLGGPVLHQNTASLRFFNAGGVDSTQGSLVTVQDPVSNDNLLEPAGDFTIEGFVKINSDINFATLAGKARSPGNNASWVIDTNNNGNLRLRVDSSVNIPDSGSGDGVWNQGFGSSFKLNDGQWHHFALTYTASTRAVTLFGDYASVGGGVLGDSGVMTFDDFPLQIGNLAGGRALDGWLDEIRYSTGVLTTDQFLYAVVPTPAALPAGLALLGAMVMRRTRH